MVSTQEFTESVEQLFTEGFLSIDQDATAIVDLVVDGVRISADLVLNGDGLPGSEVLFTLNGSL